MNKAEQTEELMTLKEAVTEYIKNLKSDIFVYNAPINNNTANIFINKILQKKDRKEIISLFLTTYGGNPHLAYRMARCIKQYYKKLRLIITGPCKSAGTLIAISSNELVFGPLGELGPLDIQLNKPDEILSSRSGLDTIQAVKVIGEHASENLNNTFIKIITLGQGNLTTKTALEIATQLTSNIFSPISAQIDPHMLGETHRMMNIAKAYGDRLKVDNIKQDGLDILISGYPSHAFVIDEVEASNLFTNVSKLLTHDQNLLNNLGTITLTPITDLNSTFICDLEEIINNNESENL